jgi:fucose permease
MICTTFIYPVFANHLSTKYGLSIEITSIFFVITMFTYFIVVQFLNKISNTLGNKLTISLGLLINVIGTLLLAPVSFLPQYIWVIIIGQMILGCSGGLITLPAISDFKNVMEKMEVDENVANDVASGNF